MSEPWQNMENQINKSEKAIHCLILLLNAQKWYFYSGRVHAYVDKNRGWVARLKMTMKNMGFPLRQWKPLGIRE